MRLRIDDDANESTFNSEHLQQQQQQQDQVSFKSRWKFSFQLQRDA